MNVLLTGSTGYIGRYLLRNLLENGHTVIATSSDPVKIIKELGDYPAWLRDLFTSPKVIWEKANFSDAVTHREPFWQDIFKKYSIDAAVNSAGVCFEQEGNTFDDVNFKAVKGLSNAISLTPQVSRFLHLSTITAGSEQARQNPDSYAGSKRRAEDYIQANPDLWAKTTIIRPITVYDPTVEERPGHIAQLSSFSPVPVLGSGKQRLQPVHVEDVAQAVNLIDKSGDSMGRILEAVGPEVITVEDWGRIVKKARGEPYEAVHIPYDVARGIAKHQSLQVGSLNPTMVKVWESREGQCYHEYDHRPFAAAVGITRLKKIGDAYQTEPVFKGRPNTQFLRVLSQNRNAVSEAVRELEGSPNDGPVYSQILRDLADGRSINRILLSALQDRGRHG